MPPLVNDFEFLSLPDHIVDVRATIIKFYMVPTLDESSQISSMEVVLMDEYGSKIHATIVKELVDAYQSKIREGAFATFINLRTAINCDPCKVSAHKLKLLFEKDTLVQEEDYTFSLAHGLAFVGIDDFLLNGTEPDHLIVSAERVYLRDGRTTNMLMIELVDEYGFVDCALYGDRVLDINGFLTNSYLCQTIVVLQFVKATIEEDRIIMHAIPGVTRMLFNPDIPYALSFRKRMSERGVLDTIPYVVILDGRMTTLENEFVKSFPRKSVAELGLIGEGGMYVTVATIKGIDSSLGWLYYECECKSLVIADCFGNFCDACDSYVEVTVPRYRIKLLVEDGTSSATLIMYDRTACSLLKKSCSALLEDCRLGLVEDAFRFLIDSLSLKRLLYSRLSLKTRDAIPLGELVLIARFFQCLSFRVTM